MFSNWGWDFQENQACDLTMWISQTMVWSSLGKRDLSSHVLEAPPSSQAALLPPPPTCQVSMLFSRIGNLHHGDGHPPGCLSGDRTCPTG